MVWLIIIALIGVGYPALWPWHSVQTGGFWQASSPTERVRHPSALIWRPRLYQPKTPQQLAWSITGTREVSERALLFLFSRPPERGLTRPSMYSLPYWSEPWRHGTSAGTVSSNSSSRQPVRLPYWLLLRCFVWNKCIAFPWSCILSPSDISAGNPPLARGQSSI